MSGQRQAQHWPRGDRFESARCSLRGEARRDGLSRLGPSLRRCPSLSVSLFLALSLSRSLYRSCSLSLSRSLAAITSRASASRRGGRQEVAACVGWGGAEKGATLSLARYLTRMIFKLGLTLPFRCLYPLSWRFSRRRAHDLALNRVLFPGRNNTNLTLAHHGGFEHLNYHGGLIRLMVRGSRRWRSNPPGKCPQ